jgi:hypothetical protein
MKKLLLCLMIAMPAYAIAGDSDMVTVEELMTIASDVAATGCKAGTAAHETAVTKKDPVAMAMADLPRSSKCTCLPNSIKAYRDKHSGADLSKKLSKKEANALLDSLTDHCRLMAFRDMIKNTAACEADTGDVVRNRKAYCGCMADGVDRLSDAELTESQSPAATATKRSPMEKLDTRCRGL